MSMSQSQSSISSENIVLSQTNDGSKCKICNKILKNNAEVKIHMSKSHSHVVSLFPPLPCAPSTSNGFTGLRSNLGKFFRPQYRYSEVESDEDVPLSQDNFEIESSLPKVVKPFSNLENSQTSSITEQPFTKIACPFSPLHLFKDEKRIRTHVGKYCDKQVDISHINLSRRSIQDKLINLHSKIHTYSEKNSERSPKSICR
jgi:hypothetical protein